MRVFSFKQGSALRRASGLFGLGSMVPARAGIPIELLEDVVRPSRSEEEAADMAGVQEAQRPPVTRRASAAWQPSASERGLSSACLRQVQMMSSEAAMYDAPLSEGQAQVFVRMPT